MNYPRVPAAFINAIAEEGTKVEAINWLQKEWNENCFLRKQLKSVEIYAEGVKSDFPETKVWMDAFLKLAGPIDDL